VFEIMSLEKWLKLTDGGLTSVRSTSLKRVDAALGRYHQAKKEADKQALRAALQDWMQEKGDGAWQSSIRNRYFAVSDLHKQLTGRPPAPDARELAALQAMRDESRRLVEVLFRGRKVSWRNEGFGWLGNRKLEAAYDLVPGGASVVIDSERIDRGDQSLSLKAEKWANDVFNEIVPVEFQVFVKYAVLSVFPNYMKELAKSVLPIIGLVSAGGDFAVNIGRVARSSYRVNRATMHSKQHINTGEPLRAIQAMIVILKRERNFDRAEALVSTAEFGAKVGGLFLDLGTGTTAIAGVSAKAAKLTNLLYALVRDCYEMKDANIEMSLGRDLRKLFKVCPLVGAYYVCCVPTSVLVNEIFDRWWDGGWRGDVEYNVVQHLEPLREQARRVIAEHRFVIKGLERFPGVLSRNDAKLEQMQQEYLARMAQANAPAGPRQIFSGL
jgi:hypothetical protein